MKIVEPSFEILYPAADELNLIAEEIPCVFGDILASLEKEE